jgi:hypothetical protein
VGVVAIKTQFFFKLTGFAIGCNYSRITLVRTPCLDLEQKAAGNLIGRNSRGKILLAKVAKNVHDERKENPLVALPNHRSY